MADAFSSAYSYLKSSFLNKAKTSHLSPKERKIVGNMRAGKKEHDQRRMQTGPTHDQEDPFEGTGLDFDTEDGAQKPIGEDEDTGYDMRTTEERHDELPYEDDDDYYRMSKAFDLALKALQPSPHHMDAGLPEDKMRHFANMQRMKQRFGRPNAPIPFNPNHPDPNIPIFTEEFAALNPFMAEANREHLGLTPLNTPPQAPLPRTAGGPRTLPPNPPLMPPVTRGARTQGQPQEIGMPMHPMVAPRPLSEEAPYGKIRESELQRLADDYGIPFAKAWTMLKALPEQQMFVERTPRENVVDDYEMNYDDRPEIDRYGARSLGTVHPAILGMLQRRTDDYHQHYGMPPNLNLDLGRDEDRRMSSEHGMFRNMPGRDERQGMSIAQGPDFNRRMYDSGGQMGARSYQSDETHHNPDRAARGGPFDSSRYINSYPEAYKRNMSGYGLQPNHKITHPTREEMRG